MEFCLLCARVFQAKREHIKAVDQSLRIEERFTARLKRGNQPARRRAAAESQTGEIHRGETPCLWRIAERLGTQGLKELRRISPVEHLEEALETLIGLTGPLFDDNIDDIQEAPTSMMDHW